MESSRDHDSFVGGVFNQTQLRDPGQSRVAQQNQPDYNLNRQLMASNRDEQRAIEINYKTPPKKNTHPNEGNNNRSFN